MRFKSVSSVYESGDGSDRNKSHTAEHQGATEKEEEEAYVSDLGAHRHSTL